RALGRLEIGLEDQRVAAIAPPRGELGASGRDAPATVLRRTEQRRKAGRRIETRPAKPVDRAVAADQRGRMTVTDQRVVFDLQALRNFVLRTKYLFAINRRRGGRSSR